VSNSRLVYSTEGSSICPRCQKALRKCKCQDNQAVQNSDGFVRISRETKGRKGAGVTIVSGLQLTGDELKAVAKELKRKCSVGGAIKNGNIQIQGDQRDVAKKFFEERGEKVRLVGG